ncbi:glycosyltransferase [Desulfolutivibrio sulfoxidireducens]|uniref:glycosyltransferase n=1 Tax=Desulfolutivibrio sulfoxidireducens TaxID=2773299 RepID=UPI00159D432D|nr:glycosyltransferase [Desulfolutivibrio sulfoxidireducens]QLA14840.1 glycosyltransferase [Desulfolutivibrio sulfoxidireducens]
MRFSIVIPAFNESAVIARCLDSVHRAARDMGPVDVWVVDNGSTDDTVAVARRAGAQVVENVTGRRKTIAALRNEGAARAGGDILAFLDADMLVPTNWLTAAAARYASGFGGILGFVGRTPDSAGLVARAWGDRLFRKRRTVMAVDYLPGRNMIMPASLFRALGGFDASLATVEDKDLTMRAVRAGYEVLSSPEAPVEHLGYESGFAEFVAKEYWRQGNTLAVLRKRGLTLRGLRNPLLSLFHLAMPLVALTFLLAGRPGTALVWGLLWPVPALVLSLRDVGREDPLFGMVFFLTFVRWIVAGVALLRQLPALFRPSARDDARGSD